MLQIVLALFKYVMSRSLIFNKALYSLIISYVLYVKILICTVATKAVRQV